MFLNRMLNCVIFTVFINSGALPAQNSNSSKTETIMHTKLIRPPYLKAGDTVAIVAPSGILNNRDKEIEQAKNLLKSWNLNVVVGKHVFNRAGHFAGTDAERCEDFQKALDDPKVKAIWCARGGWNGAYSGQYRLFQL